MEENVGRRTVVSRMIAASERCPLTLFASGRRITALKRNPEEQQQQEHTRKMARNSERHSHPEKEEKNEKCKGKSVLIA